MRIRPQRIIAFSLLSVPLLALIALFVTTRRRAADTKRNHELELVAAFRLGWTTRMMPPFDEEA